LLWVFFVVITFPFYYSFSTQRIAQFLSRNVIKPEQLEQEFLESLVRTKDSPDIVVLVSKVIEKISKPGICLIYLYDPQLGEYGLSDEEGHASGDGVRFSPQSTLVKRLKHTDFLDLGREASQPLDDDQARIDLLASRWIIPLKSVDNLVGWVALGEPVFGKLSSGKPVYGDVLDPEQKQSLLRPCGQAALAIQRAQSNEALVHLERELNVLTRVAQGISFTAAFDDILELITSQANQILPADDFRITLYQASSGLHYHVFVSEQNERLPEDENKPLLPDAGLEFEVICSQRPLITDDYERECRERGLTIAIQGVYAWMGVPLNAGAETIGAMSIASRDAERTFSREQEALLQAIADLTAGAIVKSRLLAESQHRASQLAKLNEISLELSSTLSLKPLYSKIVKNAAQILQAAASYLLMVDPHHEQVILEAVEGPFLETALGKRYAQSAGLVGQKVLDGTAKILQADQKQNLWGDEALLLEGFEMKSALAVPMRIQDRVVGAIVGINKLDGLKFNQSDQEWLTAFTNQATVAIENARLYTLTDRALAERVDELSVMQQIDRQLNASLEVDSALQITLDWALKQSQADAGLVGIVEGQALRMLAEKGYAGEILNTVSSNQAERESLHLELPIILAAINSGQVQVFVTSDDPGETNPGLLEGVKSQAVIPIQREDQIIGAIFLESFDDQTFSAETLRFLSRLSDHAAIALANAKLFDEVKEANISKSRFVSFVAHELKNPMASIKGYTELVAGGMAGPVTEMQASFLATVRSNVDRMNTIVSDLNDLTKIQVGNLRLDCTRVNLHDTLDEVTQSLRRQIEEKEQVFTRIIPLDLPNVWADAFRLSQILTNLLSNATKYTQTGGAIAVGAEVMPVIDPTSSELIHIWVQDHGIGIPLEDQKNIFQQYFRTDLAKEMAAGTGLGLNITRSLVELQGGKIWFESEAGAGTIFHFSLPGCKPA
jgi:signal transduction histidine kinase